MDKFRNFSIKRSFVLDVFVVIVILVNTGKAEKLNTFQKGDLNLGGMFPVHKKSCSCDSSYVKDSSGDCSQTYSKGLFLAEAMIYAVRLVNERGILPFDISLGYQVLDTCNSLSVAVRNALVFVTRRKRTLHQRYDDLMQTFGKQQNPFSFNDSNPGSSNQSIIAVIGAGNSESSTAVNNLLSLYKIPQVAYASSSAALSDKSRYETFLRVLPPDTLQAKAIVQLLLHFKWNYVSLVSSDDNYAGPLRKAIHEETHQLGICFAKDIIFSYLPSVAEIKQKLLTLNETEKSRVILLLASERSAEVILGAADSLNLTDRIWIASDSWSNAFDLIHKHYSLLKGSLGIMFGYTPVMSFVEHLRTRLDKHVELINKDPWLRSLSTAIHNEKLAYLLNNDTNTKDNHSDVTKLRSIFARVDYVMNSVFVLAYVIRDFCLKFDFNLNSTKAERKVKCLEKIYPQALLPLLFNRTLRGFSKNFTVDESGDPPGSYEYFNLLQSKGKQQPRNMKIGSYETLSKVLKLNDSFINLGKGKGQVPKSRCSDECLPGTYVVKSHSNPAAACCWECKECSSGQVSNVSMATTCEECDIKHLPNKNRTRCIYVPLRYLTRDHPWSVIISVFSILCFFLAIFFVLVFIRHRQSPVVRASCFEISLGLLLSIALGFLLPLLVLSKPTNHQCKAAAFLFGVVFSVILSLTLAKINRTVLILKNQMGGGVFHRKFLLSSPAHFLSVLILSAIQVSICIAWFFQNPPKPITTTILLPTFVRYLHCSGHTSIWFLISSGFLILLTLICTILAFRSRNFPENYNHARFISLAMFTFNVVWLTFMGAYYGNPQPGFHQPIIHCYAIIFSNLCLMLLMYGPKVYVIFFRPELNNARTFREMNLQHLLGEAVRTRNFSLASVGTPGHGNVYLMDCDPNEKAVQTTRVLTKNVQTQTDFEENYKRRHKTSLVSRLFGRGSRSKTGDIRSPSHKRGWSESDATKSDGKRVLSHCQSSPIPLNRHSQGDKKNKTRQGNHILGYFEESSDLGLGSIEEMKDGEGLATSSAMLRKNRNRILRKDRGDESTSSYTCFIISNDVEDNDDDDDLTHTENDGSPIDISKDDVFIVGDKSAETVGP